MSEPPLYLEPQLRSAQVKGRRCSWRELGEGARLPLILLHGIGSNASSWAGQFAGLAGERRVTAWNAPGYLASDCLDADWPAAADYAEAAIQLLDHLEIARFILLGQSLGAVIATSLALRVPDRVAALALVSPACGYSVMPGAALPDALDKRLRDLDALGAGEFASARADRLLTARATDEARKIVHRSMSEIVPEGYIQATRLLATSNLLDSVKALSVPTLVLWGAQDEITPPPPAGKLHKRCQTRRPGKSQRAATRLRPNCRRCSTKCCALFSEPTTSNEGSVVDLKLLDQVAVVTGGSSGIGLATVRVLLQEGAHVIACARRQEGLDRACAQLRAEGADCQRLMTQVCDVLEDEAVQRLADTARERFGRIDLLVNNAGQARLSTFASTTDVEWEEELRLNFSA